MSTYSVNEGPAQAAGGGGAMQIFTLAADKLCPGHQAGILLFSGTFVATKAHMREVIDWSATVLGGSKCALTNHVGKITPAGSRISKDLVDRTTTPYSQGPLAGVTDYREKLFPVAIDAESAPGSVMTVLDLPGLTLGATYTWEIKWGFLAAAKTQASSATPIRIAVDDLGMRACAACVGSSEVSVYSVGTWQGWQAFPGFYNNTPPFVGYEPSEKWALALPITTTVGGAPFGCDFGVLTSGVRRFLVSCLADNKVYLINPVTGAVVTSSAALAADAYDVAFYPGATTGLAVCATDDNNLRLLTVADAGVALASSINVGVAGRVCATNFYTGTTVGLWVGSRGTGVANLRGFQVGGTQIGSTLTLQTLAGVEVTRIKRIATGPNIETLLVATNKGKVFHVSKDGQTILGTWTHPGGTSIPISDIAAGPNGVLCYVIDGVAAASSMHYFWLPNTVGGPAYQHFDTSSIGGVTGLAIAVNSNEDVLLGTSANRITDIPGGGAFCRATNPIAGEHLTVAFIES